MSESVDPRPLIAHVVYRFAVGGLENGVVNLINGLPRDRWRHAVVSLTSVDPSFAARVLRDDVEFVELRKPPGPGVYQLPKLYRILRSLRPGVVHSRNLAALEAQVPAWAAAVPVRIHSEHGRELDDVHGDNRRNIRARRLYGRFTHHQIALSRELADYLQRKVGVPPAKLSVICNGVDAERFRPSQIRQPIHGCPFTDDALWMVGTVGRMQTVKAQPLLVRGFIEALQMRPELSKTMRLVLVGDGPLRAQCELLLESEGLAHLAWFAGERSDVPDVMRGLDCFVLPSLVEGISNTILEAMATGLPILATAVGGSPDLVMEGRTGFLVPPGDITALADGLIRMAEDGPLARSLGAAGRARVEEEFNLSTMVAAYGGLYERLIKPAHAEAA